MKNFPNGFDSWHETHFEVVAWIMEIHNGDERFGLVHKRHNEQGLGGLYELAEELTDEFETTYKGREWDGDFHETIWKFLEEKTK
jgi:hypothetical protein